MGKHADRRHAAPRPSFRAVLKRTSLLVVLPLVVGAIALNSSTGSTSLSTVEGQFAASPTDTTLPIVSRTTGREADPIAPSPGELASKAAKGKKSSAPATRTSRTKKAVPRSFVRITAGSTLPTEFRVSSFNVLGFGHTVKGGNKPGYADGRTRMRWTVGLLRANDVSVAGLQEFQTEQYQTFNAIAGGEYAVYPGTSLGRAAVQNSLVWRRSNWELVEAHTVAIPYFGGERIAMPYVLLRNVQTGRQIWFMNFHNPADAHGPAQKWRDLAVSIEIGLINSLKANTGMPVVMTGDFNDRDRFICPVSSRAGMHSADGGYTDGSGCHTPRPMQVDWVVGSSEVTFSGYVSDRSTYVRKSSDHPMIRSWTTVAPAYNADECVTAEGKEPGLYCPAS